MDFEFLAFIVSIVTTVCVSIVGIRLSTIKSDFKILQASVGQLATGVAAHVTKAEGETAKMFEALSDMAILKYRIEQLEKSNDNNTKKSPV